MMSRDDATCVPQLALQTGDYPVSQCIQIASKRLSDIRNPLIYQERIARRNI